MASARDWKWCKIAFFHEIQNRITQKLHQISDWNLANTLTYHYGCKKHVNQYQLGQNVASARDWKRWKIAFFTKIQNRITQKLHQISNWNLANTLTYHYGCKKHVNQYQPGQNVASARDWNDEKKHFLRKFETV